MKRQRVKSSSIQSIGYDEPSQTLEVKFAHGGIYQYFDVASEVFEQFLAAPSKGQFFHDEIRDAYPYAQME